MFRPHCVFAVFAAACFTLPIYFDASRHAADGAAPPAVERSGPAKRAGAYKGADGPSELRQAKEKRLNAIATLADAMRKDPDAFRVVVAARRLLLEMKASGFAGSVSFSFSEESKADRLIAAEAAMSAFDRSLGDAPASPRKMRDDEIRVLRMGRATVGYHGYVWDTADRDVLKDLLDTPRDAPEWLSDTGRREIDTGR